MISKIFKKITRYFCSDLKQDWMVILFFIFIPVFFVLLFLDSIYANVGFVITHSLDEYVFHGILLHMFSAFESYNVKTLFGTGFYQYGFIFFFINLIVVIPFFITGHSAVAIFIPRMITSFFAVLSLVYLYKIVCLYLKRLPAMVVVIFLLFMPAFWVNATWFHPDWMMTAFLLMAIYFLFKDKYNFSDNYWLSIFFYALAVTTKYQILTFSPILLVYVFYSQISELQLAGISKSLKKLLIALLIICAVFFLTNPYLFHPKGARLFVGSLVSNLESNVTNHGGGQILNLKDKVHFAISEFYMNYIFLLLLVVTSLFCLYNYLRTRQEFIFFVLAIAFIINLVYLLFGVNKAWNHYYLPVVCVGVILISLPLKRLKYSYQLSLLLLLTFIQVLFNINKIPYYFDLRHDYQAQFIDYGSAGDYTQDQQREISDFIINTISEKVSAQSNILISVYTGFDYEKLNLKYSQLNLLWGPLSEAQISKSALMSSYLLANPAASAAEVDKIGMSFVVKDFIILKKNERFINIGILDSLNIEDKKPYLEANQLLDKIIKGNIGYRLIGEDKYVYIFQKKL